jgi:hypothetical protein
MIEGIGISIFRECVEKDKRFTFDYSFASPPLPN